MCDNYFSVLCKLNTFNILGQLKVSKLKRKVLKLRVS